jgi:hypothetical protein
MVRTGSSTTNVVQHARRLVRTTFTTYHVINIALMVSSVLPTWYRTVHTVSRRSSVRALMGIKHTYKVNAYRTPLLVCVKLDIGTAQPINVQRFVNTNVRMGVIVPHQIIAPVLQNGKEITVKIRFANTNVRMGVIVHHQIIATVLQNGKEITVKFRFANPNVRMGVYVFHQIIAPVLENGKEIIVKIWTVIGVRGVSGPIGVRPVRNRIGREVEHAPTPLPNMNGNIVFSTITRPGGA